jgi:hypothetical protein
MKHIFAETGGGGSDLSDANYVLCFVKQNNQLFTLFYETDNSALQHYLWIPVPL